MRIIKIKKIEDENAKVGFFANIVSSFFYTGYFPIASGTIGSLAALIIFFIKIFYDPPILSLLIAAAFFAGIFSTKIMMRRYGNDPSVVVIDEAVGMWITVLIVLLLNKTDLSLLVLFICFIAFRFFDITKIQPAKYFDSLHTGLGVMMDDVIAGIYAGIVSSGILYLVKS